MTKIWLIAAVALAAGSPDSAGAASACAMPAAEQLWVEGALRASDEVMLRRLALKPDPRPAIIVFNEQCRFEARGAGALEWLGTPHSGKIALPGGAEIDAGVTSFASRVDETGQRFFVMALPTIWDAAKLPISGDHLGLTGVFLHEFSHTRQMDVLQPRFEAASAVYKLPADFSDDSIQKHFKDDPAYAAVIEKEIDLLYRAAAEPDPLKARGLAQQALALIEARQKRWFAGEDAKLKPYDDLFLTMEGFGQWVAYAWLADPRGGGLTPAAAQSKMRGSRRWWSQDEGLALFLVIDRFLPNWPAQAFAEEPALGIDLLRQVSR